MISKSIACAMLSFCFVSSAFGEDIAKQNATSGAWNFSVTPDEFGDPPSITLGSISTSGLVAVFCHDNIYEFRFINGEDYSTDVEPILSVKFKIGTKITETMMLTTSTKTQKLMIAGSIGEIKADPDHPNETPYIASKEILQGIENSNGAFSIKAGDYTAKFGTGAKSLFPKFRAACESLIK